VSALRRRLFLILGLTLVLVLSAVVFGLSGSDPEQRADAPIAQVSQGVPGTVVLVPGYGGSTSALEVLADRLRAVGRTAVVVSLPGDGTDDLTSYVPVLEATVQDALRAGAPSVDVVGYSAGGVVARLWLNDGGTAQTRRVVTLGSPHHGAALAGAGAVLAPDRCPTACRQLVPGSDLLDGLNRGDETPDGPLYLSLWSTSDQTVTPTDTARLEGAVDVVLQDVCPGATTAHSQLPRDPQVQGIVLDALGAGPLTAPTTCPA